MDVKSMSLDEIIKKDKGSNKKGGPGGDKGGRAGRGGGKKGPAGPPSGGRGGRRGGRAGRAGPGGPPQGGRARFDSDMSNSSANNNNNNLFKPRKTQNMIQKDRRGRGPRGVPVPRRSGPPGFKNEGGRRFSDERILDQRRPARGVRGGPPGAGLSRRPLGGQGGRDRGGLARGPKKALAAPKRQKTLKLGDGDNQNKQVVTKTKTMRPSNVKLKVRNIDEKQVTNDDLKKLFAKIGDLKVCRFDRNEFGQFLGSATVTYERAEDASQAISEYHGAFLDDKVLTVEYDMVPTVTKVVKPMDKMAQKPREIHVRKQSGFMKMKSSAKGKTLRVN